MEVKKELDIFLRNYGCEETSQSNQEATIDSQIKNLSLSLAETIQSSPIGTVVDIGCGNGILLRRLSEITPFNENKSWLYLGADFLEKHQNIITLSFELGLHRRVEVLGLNELYSDWLSPETAPRPLVVMIRNVFHELNINDTAKMLDLLRTNLEATDRLFIQDLLVFPKAERGNVCWVLSNFISLLSRCGFDCTYVEEPTPRGNRWFTLTARLKKNLKSQGTTSKNIVIQERKNQFDCWSQFEKAIPEDFDRNNGKVALLDFDLQLAALQRQLINVNAIPTFSKEEERRIAQEVFEKHLNSYDPSVLGEIFSPIERPSHFRDRANSQDALENFLLSESQVCVICGGPFMGKSDLISEVLHRRAHGRHTVLLDAQFTSSVWNFIEQYFFGIGCSSPYDLLSGFASLVFKDLTSSLSILVNNIGINTIVVFDHFERLLDPNGTVQDLEVIEFLQLISSAPNAKVIITSRRMPNMDFVPAAISIDTTQPPVGRFPKGKHVENVLDDFIDRATWELSSYPDELIQAIDRVPYLAVLAAKIIKNEGPRSIDDPNFLSLLRNRLREELLQRVLSDLAKPAVKVASFLRIPVPRIVIEGLASKESVREAEELGLIYHTHGQYGHELLTGLSTLRYRSDEEDEFTEMPPGEVEIHADKDKQHHEISQSYVQLYREEDDPKWIREAYYHSVAAGNIQSLRQFGALYRGELFWAGDYWFRVRKNFKAALEAFKAAKRLGLHTYRTDLRLAACLMRCNDVDEGTKLYEKLFKKYQNAKGVKTSYIDSLLYLHRYDEALDKLIEFGFNNSDGVWIAHQYGRSYFGLRHYKDSLVAFKLALDMRGEPIDYYSVARSYHRLGEQNNVGIFLKKGLNYFKNNFRLNLSYASHLIQVGDTSKLEEAESILTKLHELSPFNGGVLQQICKLFCSVGRVDEAIQLVGSNYSSIYPESYRIPIRIEILLAQGKWHDSINMLNNIHSDDEHLVGLKKKIFLRWARAEESVENQKLIAQKGLKVNMAPSLNSNIPILVSSARLAHISEDENAFMKFHSKIEEINPNIAESLKSENSNIYYWEDSAFQF